LDFIVEPVLKIATERNTFPLGREPRHLRKGMLVNVETGTLSRLIAHETVHPAK
jgi:hypothetical protein